MRQAHAFAQHGDVALIVEEIGIDCGRVRRILRGEPHGAPAFRPQHAGVQRYPVAVDLLAPVIFQHRGYEVPLDIGAGCVGRNLPEPARLGVGRGHRAGPLAAMLHHGAEHAYRPFATIADRYAADRLPAGDIVDMILQVAADGGAIDQHRDIQRIEMAARPDAREHQDLRGIERACREDDAAPRENRLAAAALADRDARYPATLDHQLLDQGAGADIEVGLVADRLDIGAAGRPALSRALRHLVEPEARLFLSVEILRLGHLQRGGALHESATGIIGPVLVGYEQRPAFAVVFVRSALVRLAFLEPRQHIFVGPAIAAHRGPIVVVPRIPANIDHRVDRGGSTQPLAARLKTDASVQALLRHGFVAVVGRIAEEGHHSRGLDAEIVVAPARLDQADTALPADGQPPGHRAACASAPDYDVVILVHADPLRLRKG